MRLDAEALAAHAPPDVVVLLLIAVQFLAGQPNGAVQGDGQAAVPAAQHDKAQDELAPGVPAAAEAISPSRRISETSKNSPSQCVSGARHGAPENLGP